MEKELRKLISLILTEEIGRNYHTVDTNPHTFKSFSDYDININPVSDSRYAVEIFFNGKKINNHSTFKNYEEANHHARMIIDKHRITHMNQ